MQNTTSTPYPSRSSIRFLRDLRTWRRYADTEIYYSLDSAGVGKIGSYAESNWKLGIYPSISELTISVFYSP